MILPASVVAVEHHLSQLAHLRLPPPLLLHLGHAPEAPGHPRVLTLHPALRPRPSHHPIRLRPAAHRLRATCGDTWWVPVPRDRPHQEQVRVQVAGHPGRILVSCVCSHMSVASFVTPYEQCPL